jgi:hypothetical protein
MKMLNKQLGDMRNGGYQERHETQRIWKIVLRNPSKQKSP